MTAELSDARLTYLLALGTGEILKGVRNVGLLRGRTLGDAGDELAQSWIARVLEQHRPDDGFLSEEAADNPSRLKRDRVWIIDPLDGTKEFATGRQDWAVHIALVENGAPVNAAVGLPDLGVVFRSDDVRAVTGPYAKKIAISHNRPPAVTQWVAQQLGSETVPLGSAGAKAMHVLLGDSDATSTLVVSTNGIPPHRLECARLPAYIARASMVPSWSTTRTIRTCRTCSSAAQS